MKVVANTRQKQGSSASRRLRRAGKVPGIVYGGTTTPAAIEVEHNPLYHALRVEAFHSSILDLEIDGNSEQVLLRDVHWHPYKRQVMHIDFQRVSADQLLTTSVPLHFVNQEISPAVKLSAAIVSHVLTEVEVSCLPRDLPSFIEVDMSGLTVEKSIHVSDLKLPAGVQIVASGDADPVIAVAMIKGGGGDDAKDDGAAAKPAG